MAVPAQRERLWGAQSASELALAGIVNFVVSDSCHGDVLAFWMSTPSLTRGIIHREGKLSTKFL